MSEVGLKCSHLGDTATPSDAKILGSSNNVTCEDHSPMMLPDIIHKLWMGTSGNYKPTSGIRTVLNWHSYKLLAGMRMQPFLSANVLIP